MGKSVIAESSVQKSPSMATRKTSQTTQAKNGPSKMSTGVRKKKTSQISSGYAGNSGTRKTSEEVSPNTRRKFLVTHTSDNWRIRQAQRKLEQDRTDTELELNKRSSTSKVPKTDENSNVVNGHVKHVNDNKHEINGSQNGLHSNNESTSTQQKSAIDSFMLRAVHREKTIVLPSREKVNGSESSSTDVSSRKDSPPRTNSSSGVSSGSSQSGKRSPEQHDGQSSSKPNGVRSESPDAGHVEVNGRAVPSAGSRPAAVQTSDDFDTDLSADEADEDNEKKREAAKNRTLKTYMAACNKCGLIPNPSFMRQCGQSSIDMRNKMLSYKDVKPIAIALVADKRASFLDISENPLGPLGTAYIAEMLYANKNIMELNLSCTQPGTEGMAALAQTLATNTTLRRLYLGDNGLQQCDGEHVAEMIVNAAELRELYLNNNTLGFTGTTRIASALACNKGRLSVLSLQYNNIRTDSAVQMALCLAKNTTLRALNLAWNGFGVEGCRALSKSLGANTTLREIDLTCNRLGIKCLEPLVKALKANTTLACLKLGANPLTTEGAKALITAITSAEESGLTHVELQDIPIDTEFLELKEKLKSSRVIEVYHDSTIHMATSDMTREFDGTNLDRFDPVTVLFEYMKKDNLRVIDLFQFFDTRKRDKLSKSDLRDGVNILMIPFTEHALDVIMKTVDLDKDGFITLDEMVKAYRENDRAVKLRRIKASQKKRKDNGLEDLWRILKEIIEKRKSENERRSVENVGQSSLPPR